MYLTGVWVPSRPVLLLDQKLPRLGIYGTRLTTCHLRPGEWVDGAIGLRGVRGSSHTSAITLALVVDEKVAE